MGASPQPTSLRCRSSAFEPSLAVPPAATRKRNCNRGLPTARGRNTRRSSRAPRRLSWESGGGGGFADVELNATETQQRREVDRLFVDTDWRPRSRGGTRLLRTRHGAPLQSRPFRI